MGAGDVSIHDIVKDVITGVVVYEVRFWVPGGMRGRTRGTGMTGRANTGGSGPSSSTASGVRTPGGGMRWGGGREGGSTLEAGFMEAGVGWGERGVSVGSCSPAVDPCKGDKFLGV
ncbi:hypothetical protein OG21DRAFT_1526968 [Imleria badia]|nr:hypothetical protein OG21DRAFT_1526968 [Imleria badia]